MEPLTIVSQAFNKIFDGVYKIGASASRRKGWDINNVQLTQEDIAKRTRQENTEIDEDNRRLDHNSY